MKRKKILGLLLASTFMFNLTSCSVVEIISDQIQEHQVVTEDNELSKAAYKEYSNTFTDLTYEEFLEKVIVTNKVFAVYTIYNIEDKFTLTFNEKKLDEKVEYFTESNSTIGNTYEYYNDSWRLSSVEKKTGELTEKTSYKYTADNLYYGKTVNISDLLNNKYERLTYIYYNDEFVCTKKESKYKKDWLTDFYITFDNTNNTYKEKHEYKYTDNGVLIERTEYIFFDDKWVMSFKEEYINGEFRMTEQTHFPTSGTFLILGKSEYERDQNGNIINEITYDYKDGEFILNEKIEYKYDAGKVIKTIEYEYINNEWKKTNISKFINNVRLIEYCIDSESQEHFFEFDEEGHNTLELVYLDGNPIKKVEHTFENGKYRYSIFYDYKNDEWVPSRKAEFGYDELDNKIYEAHYNYVGDEWLPEIIFRTDNHHTIEYYYYDDGTKSEEETYNNKRVKYKIIYNDGYLEEENCTYNDEGYVVSWQRSLNDKITSKGTIEYLYDSETNSSHTKTETLYTYDEFERLIKYEYSDYSNSTKEKTEYEYADNYLKVTYSKFINDWVVVCEENSNFDSVKNEYVLDNKYEKEYDEKGRLINSIYYEVKDSNLVKINGEKTTYNDNNDTKTVYGFDFIDDTTIDTYKITYTLNYQDKSFRYDTKEEYFYDDNGNPYEEYHYEYFSGEWELTGKYKYYLGKKKEELKIDIHRQKNETTYDDDGKILTWISSIWKNDSWTFDHKFEYIYEDGNCIECNSYQYKDGQWVLWSAYNLTE